MEEILWRAMRWKLLIAATAVAFPVRVVFPVSREFRWAPKPIELDPVRHFLQITGLLRISFI
jgi:hypothetical protein